MCKSTKAEPAARSAPRPVRGGAPNALTKLSLMALDGFLIAPIINRTPNADMNTLIFSLSLIILISVLIIKDLIVVGMAPVKTK